MFGQDQKLALRRAEMVQRQLRRRGIRDERLLAVMGEVPREAFLPTSMQGHAYEDGAQPIGLDQTISQPYIVALMTESLELRPTHRVLEIGTGSGYQTAILSKMVEWVYSIERLEPLAELAQRTLDELDVSNVTLLVGDGTLGWPDGDCLMAGLPVPVAFERILCAAASLSVPAAWVRQLANGGRMVLPAGSREAQQLLRIDKAGDVLSRVPLCDVRFVPLIGQAGW